MTARRSRRRRLAILSLAGLIAALACTAAGAAALTVGTKKLGVAAPTVPPLYPNALTFANKGATTGKAETADTVTVGYSAALQASTICTGAATSVGTTSTTGAVIAINNAAGAGNDTLTITSVPTAFCSSGLFRLGTIDLGSSAYVSATASFTGSTVAFTQNAASATVVITLGSTTGAPTTVTSGTAAVVTPDTAVTDTSGHSIGTNTAASTTTVQF